MPGSGGLFESTGLVSGASVGGAEPIGGALVSASTASLLSAGLRAAGAGMLSRAGTASLTSLMAAQSEALRAPADAADSPSVVSGQPLAVSLAPATLHATRPQREAIGSAAAPGARSGAPLVDPRSVSGDEAVDRPGPSRQEPGLTVAPLREPDARVEAGSEPLAAPTLPGMRARLLSAYQGLTDRLARFLDRDHGAERPEAAPRPQADTRAQSSAGDLPAVHPGEPAARVREAAAGSDDASTRG